MKYICSILAMATVLSACTNSAKEKVLVQQAVVTKIKDSLKLDSFKKVEVKQKEQAVVAARAQEEKETVREEEKIGQAAAPVVQNDETAVPAKKKGWSSAAKGTVIGAGAGALGGVLIDKKDGRGAIIGGVVGAGTGYLIGRDKDKKSGRVQPKN